MKRHPSLLLAPLVALALAAGLWTLYRLAGVILLLVLSVFFAYLIAPLVDKLRRPFSVGDKHFALPRLAAIGFAYVFVFGSIAAARRAGM